MHRNLRLFLLIGSVAIETACGHAYVVHYADLTAGYVGCPREGIDVDQWHSDPMSGLQSWRARCRGHEWFCAAGGRGLAVNTPFAATCTEAVPEFRVTNEQPSCDPRQETQK